MIVHAEINQEGKLQNLLPKQFHGKRVVLSVVSEENMQLLIGRRLKTLCRRLTNYRKRAVILMIF